MIAGRMNCTYSELWKIEGMRLLYRNEDVSVHEFVRFNTFFACLFYFIAS